MRQILRCAATMCMCLSLVGLLSRGIAEDKKVTKNDVPVAVLKSFEGAYPKATVKKYATEVEKGETFYELETIEGKIERDLLYKADGTLVELEEILTPDMVPVAIARAIAAELPKGRIVSGEKTTRGKVDSFEIVVADGKEKVIVILNDEAKVQKKTVSTPKNAKAEEQTKEED